MIKDKIQFGDLRTIFTIISEREKVKSSKCMLYSVYFSKILIMCQFSGMQLKKKTN